MKKSRTQISSKSRTPKSNPATQELKPKSSANQTHKPSKQTNLQQTHKPIIKPRSQNHRHNHWPTNPKTITTTTLPIKHISQNSKHHDPIKREGIENGRRRRDFLRPNGSGSDEEWVWVGGVVAAKDLTTEESLMSMLRPLCHHRWCRL